MANITGKNAIFFVTSPRSPLKMREEIQLLINKFGGKEWDKKNQSAFAEELSSSDFYEGKIQKNFDFSARDRINRGPKSLGFVDLYPKIALTPAGHQFLSSKRPEEILLRQLLKFQLPSPFHVDADNKFCVKPYLELLRIIRELKSLSKDEISIFVMQLTSINRYELIVNKISEFRKMIQKIDRRKTSYRRIVREVSRTELKLLYESEIRSGNLKTRQSKNISLEKFLKTKSSNFRDYADASIRYLRAAGIVTFDYKRNRVMLANHKLDEIDYILKNTGRLPSTFASDLDFKKYMFSSNNLSLLSDDVEGIFQELKSLGLTKNQLLKLRTLSLDEIKDVKDNLLIRTREVNISKQVQDIQSYNQYEDILNTYSDISSKNIVDPSLVFEWNTWRAFTMLDDGIIKANFRFDLEGMPLFTAPGNMPDIECQYKDFDLIVEVTLSSGQK